MDQNLTSAQKAAVEHFEGPLMVLAGPGSGKTRVITHRIARLIDRGVQPDQILALTFTNKAAREMAERVRKLLGGTRVQVSTFHRFCSRLLRRWPESVGLKNNFTILDQSDQVQLVRRQMKDLGFDTTHHDPRRVLNRISKARNDLISAEQFRQRYEERVGDPLDAVIYDVFPQYEQQLLHHNAVDFDALLLHVVELLGHDGYLREFLDSQFRFVLVDEYQDTNLAQYRIVRAMSQNYPNLCATGDPDQSIYGWRGARPANISQFETDFPEVSIVSLDQNFRSTASIVRCADRLISNNVRRHRKELTTPNEEGEAVRLQIFSNGNIESDRIAEQIADRVSSGERSYSDFAVFYRVNALSRSLETSFSRRSVPFQVAAGYSFYERTEVRDLIAYLRLIENQSDESAMLRIVNRPARGIGEKTLLRLRNFAEEHSITLFDAARKCDEVPLLTSRVRKPLHLFTDLILKLHQQAADVGVAGLIEKLISEIDYLSLWTGEFDEVDQDRLANVHELVNAARQYDATNDGDDGDDDSEPPSLQGFLELASLTSEADSVDPDLGAVTLMTMHAAKGLEFSVVYIVGLENGLIPHDRAVKNGDPASFAEERRLLFVGVTRAKEELVLTQTRERAFRGSRRSSIASPFTSEMILQTELDDPDHAGMRQPVHQTTTNEHVLKARERYQRAQAALNRPMLMSAADLEKQRDRDVPALFSPGAFVRHPRYGRGVVIEASDGTSRGTVTIEFERDQRRETFVASRCPLQPVGPPATE